MTLDKQSHLLLYSTSWDAPMHATQAVLSRVAPAPPFMTFRYFLSNTVVCRSFKDALIGQRCLSKKKAKSTCSKIPINWDDSNSQEWTQLQTFLFQCMVLFYIYLTHTQKKKRRGSGKNIYLHLLSCCLYFFFFFFIYIF